MGTRTRPAPLVAAAVVLSLAGCTDIGPYPYVEVRPTLPVAEPVGDRCPRDGAGLVDPSTGVVAGTLPGGFAPERVRQCRLDLQPTRTPSGELRYTITEITSPVSSALLAALMLPDQAFDPRDHAACAAIYTAPTYVLLVDHAGAAYRPHLPEEPCGGPRDEMQAALQGLVPSSRSTSTVEVPV